MTAIQCPGCKARITVPGLINCPRCQTFMDPPFLREHVATQADAARGPGSGLGLKEWFGLAILGHRHPDRPDRLSHGRAE